jgi:16S rRNA (guanine1516-N2)-methyltransferase
MKICVLAEGESYFLEAKQLANNLNYAFLEQIFVGDLWKKEVKRLKNHLSEYQALLLVQEKGLSLLPLTQSMSPIYIDFTNSLWKRRLFNISSKTELAAKALGISKKIPKHILDANAGLGQDSFVFAALGAQVSAFERSPLVYCLLNDALMRAAKDAELSEIAQRIQLNHEDSIQHLNTAELIDCHAIYLDPMFPEKKSQALAKKEMQVFQSLLDSDKDAEDLLDAALIQLSNQSLCTRVVLKRPKSAAILHANCLNNQIMGKAMRFDCYFK